MKRDERFIKITVTDNHIQVREVRSVDGLALMLETANRNPVNFIYTYTQGNTYMFGAKLLDANKDFVTAFCFGFDEIQLLDETKFDSMVKMYSENTQGVTIETLTI